MNKLKSFDDFVNENLVAKGEYNFYGPGSLMPIVQKLLSEGKGESVIRTYLYSIGVAPWRIEKVFNEMNLPEISLEKEMNEGKKATFEEKAAKFLETLNEEDDEVSEASRWKGKEIYPNWVKPSDIEGFVKKESDLEVGRDYVLYEPGMDSWQAEYTYKGKIKGEYTFSSSSQFSTAPDERFTRKELDAMIKDLELAVMESEEISEKALINKKPKRTIRAHSKVKPGNVATDYNDDAYTVVGVGTVADLADFDDSGAAEELDPNEEAIAVLGRGGFAVYSYDPDGAVVYEGEEYDGELDEETINEFNMPDFWEFFTAGAGWELGKAAAFLGLAIGLVVLGGITATAASLIAKARGMYADYKDKKGAKEAIDFLQKNAKMKELIQFSKDLMKHRKKKVDKRRKNSDEDLKALKRVEKEMVKKRQEIGAELVAEMKKAKLSKSAVDYLAWNIPYVSTALKMNRMNEAEELNEFMVKKLDKKDNFDWEFEINDPGDKKLYKALTDAGIEFGTANGKLAIMGDGSTDNAVPAIRILHKFGIKEGVNEAKKKTFEDAANAFLLGLAGSDAINDDKDEEKVEEKLNKKTLQVEEGDGEDIDDMIDDLADGDEDEYQGPDDEAPESGDEEEIKDGDDDSSSDLEDAVKDAKKDKKKLEKIKKLLDESKVTEDITRMLNDGAMSEIHLLAKEAKDEKDFMKKAKEFVEDMGVKFEKGMETMMKAFWNDMKNESVEEAKEVELENGKEVEDKEDIEDEETGDEIQVEEESVNNPYIDAVTEGLKHRFGK